MKFTITFIIEIVIRATFTIFLSASHLMSKRKNTSQTARNTASPKPSKYFLSNEQWEHSTYNISLFTLATRKLRTISEIFWY